jgi:hypothetical protein
MGAMSRSTRSSSSKRADRSVSHQTEFDLTAGYNRIAESWYPVFGPHSQSIVPVAACAYPINMGEHMIAVIRDQVLPEDHHLSWQMRLATSEGVDRGQYHLHCNWQGCAWQYDDERFLFIENAVGWVDPVSVDDDSQLGVQVSFGRPSFVGHVATMVVEFLVDELDTTGAALLQVLRSFRIHADGRRERLT